MMDKEVQIALLAGVLGVAGTLLGSVIQNWSSERAEKRRQVQAKEMTIRLERREAFIRLLATYQAGIRRIDETSRPAYRLQQSEKLEGMANKDFDSLQEVIGVTYNELNYAKIEMFLFQTGTIGEAWDEAQGQIRALRNLTKDSTLADFRSSMETFGEKYGALILAMRESLGYE
jgi:hypothetical protein